MSPSNFLPHLLLLGLSTAMTAHAAPQAATADAPATPASAPAATQPASPAAAAQTPRPAPKMIIPKVTLNPSIVAPPGNTVSDMINAIRQDDCAQLGKILKSGANPNQFDSFGYTPLTVAALDKRAACIKLLTDAGADLNLASSGGWSPLIGAAMSGASGEVLALLIDKGADINARNQWGCTALYYAAGFGALGSVNYLLERGAAYPGTGAECPTPMKIAELRGYTDLIARFKLLEGKAAPTGKADATPATSDSSTAAARAAQ